MKKQTIVYVMIGALIAVIYSVYAFNHLEQIRAYVFPNEAFNIETDWKEYLSESEQTEVDNSEAVFAFNMELLRRYNWGELDMEYIRNFMSDENCFPQGMEITDEQMTEMFVQLLNERTEDNILNVFGFRLKAISAYNAERMKTHPEEYGL